MNDKTLLELAAKAYGIVISNARYGEKLETLATARFIGDQIYFFSKTGNVLWNPLTDDGDALRLAVKLELSQLFDSMPDGLIVEIGIPWHDTLFNTIFTEPIGKDKYSATRRAIVRAAAEIGKAA
jgi:hypothetical protein